MRKHRFFNRQKQPASIHRSEVMKEAVIRKCVWCGHNHVESSMFDVPGLKGKVCSRCYPEAMKQDKFKLHEKHLEKAKAMAELSHPKPSCRYCYGRGWTAVNNRNEIVTCKCINADLMMHRWKSYVRATPELHEFYAWALEGWTPPEPETLNTEDTESTENLNAKDAKGAEAQRDDDKAESNKLSLTEVRAGGAINV